MGIIISCKMFSSQNQKGLYRPIIYCCPYEKTAEQAVSISKELTQALYDCLPEQRTRKLEECIAGVIYKLPDDCIIKDFDVIFNPEYEVDVLKILEDICKSKTFSIIWPGRLEGDKLIYAEEGYKDYQEYNVNNYDVTCIKA